MTTLIRFSTEREEQVIDYVYGQSIAVPAMGDRVVLAGKSYRSLGVKKHETSYNGNRQPIATIIYIYLKFESTLIPAI